MRINKKLRVKNLKLPLVLAACWLAFGFVTQVIAQTSPLEEETTPSAEKIQEIRKQAQEKVMALKKSAKKRAFWGELAEISGSTLVLEGNPRGEKRAKTDETTDFFLGKTPIKFEDLEIGYFILALGYVNENEALQAKRVVALKTPPKPAIRRYAVYGEVFDIPEDEKILALTHPLKETTYEVKITSKTIISKKVEGEIKKSTFGQIEIGDHLVVIGTKEEENETITARTLHIIPSQAFELEEVTPTPEE